MMAFNPYARAERHAGRMAVVEHRLKGGGKPRCPWSNNSRRAYYWKMGAREGERLVGELLSFAPNEGDPNNA